MTRTTAAVWSASIAERRRQECTRKRRYTSESAAMLAAKRARDRTMDEDAPPIYAYRCPWGDWHWHIGHMPRPIAEQSEMRVARRFLSERALRRREEDG